MRRYIKAILAIVLVLGATSCQDWLTVEPEGKLLKENFWKTTADVNSAVAAMYNSLQGSTDENLIWGELRADLFDIGSSYADYQRIAESNISASNGAVSWSHYYNTINLANTLMYYNKEVYGEDVTFTKELMDQVDAEAMFVRALNHFYLVRLWRDVPLMNMATISDTSTIFVAKSTEKEVINFLIKDLIKAKDMASDDINLKGRANKYAIMALLADIYLWDEQYQMAVNYCDSVTAGGYSLEPNETWFSLFYPGNSAVESIFEVQFDEALDDETNPIYGTLLPVNGEPQLVQDKEVVPLLFTNISDIRTCSNRFQVEPSNKYLSFDIVSGIKRTSSYEDANFIYYRYADMILIKAEALNELGGHEEEVNELLQLIRDRAGVIHTTVNGQSNLRAEILEERAREFLMEGKRWFDVLRFAKRDNYSTENKNLVANMLLAGVNVKQKAILEAYVYDSNGYYLPLPESDILYNPNLVQNPFYDKY